MFCPKMGELMVTVGFLKFRWLNALMKSARNRIFHRSVTLKVFCVVRLVRTVPGPRNVFLPRFPAGTGNAC